MIKTLKLKLKSWCQPYWTTSFYQLFNSLSCPFFSNAQDGEDIIFSQLPLKGAQKTTQYLALLQRNVSM